VFRGRAAGTLFAEGTDMRSSILVMLVAAGLAGSSAIACGGDNPSFSCGEQAISNGSTVECSGHFGTSTATATYSCEPIASTLTVRSLGPQSPGGLQPIDACPPGTTPQSQDVQPSPDGSPSSGGTSGSSGGSSSGAPTGSPSDTSGDTPSGGETTTTTPPSTDTSGAPACSDGYRCTTRGKSTHCVCTKCDVGYIPAHGSCVPKGNNGVGNGLDPQPPGNPPINDGPGTSPGNPGAKKR
jgi:hypothetical protein